NIAANCCMKDGSDCQTQAVQNWQLGYLFPQKMDPGEQMARCIAEDKKGRIWIGCDDGLIRVIHSDSGTDFSSYHNEGPNGPIFKSPWIFSICPHAENPDLLWLATMSGGLALFDAQNIKLSYLDYDNGINLVIGMVPDDEHNLWLATNKGIQKYLPAADMFVSYAYLRHIPKITLNTAAVFKDPSGSIIMGGAGLVSIAPHALKPQPVNWDLAVTDIQINRASATAGNSGNKVKFGRQHELSLHLTHDDRFLSIHLSVPAATIPEATIYRYRLTGLHKEWVFLGQNRTVELAGLAPGNYRLEVQAAASGEPWAEAKTASIPISIAPPWYAGIPAYCVYMLLLATLIGAGFRYQRKRLSLQFSADFNQKELERLQDMDNFKNRFFAYIAHEFKTPLTIIMGAGEYLRQLHRHDSVREFPEAVIREGNNMLSLIHELIDITKLQDKSIEFRFKTLDIVPFMEKIIATWKPVADAAQIDLLLSTEFPTKLVDIDQTRMQYIINNLLANAIKHTPLEGNIYLLLENEDQNTIRIRVADSGPGIAPGDLPYIFEKYFRGGQKKYEPYQFGLGLSFVKELIELMGGEISVKSTFGEGAVFKILLPLRAQQKGYKDQQDYTPLIASYKTNMDQSVKAGPDAPQLLIVDDHPSIQSYLKQVLQPFFQLTFAKNGIEGLEFAIQQIPDLILTDVIMPVMDGITMTQQLKSNQLTNHIPVVILSSKNDIMDRLSGQEKGADAYLGKPFNDRELILTLHNLNRLQQLWKDRYKTITTSGSSLSGTEEMQDFFGPAVVSGNDVFMQSILDAFEKKFSSESFDAIQLAALLNVSKAQLYRKISKISDEGVMELLRNFRLQKAMGLLAKHPEISTKEVAFKVGFKEYSHFSASFKKCFGQPPSEWRKNNLNG
ncbi:MAG TPA: hypothetical protein DCF33_14215, partial [Saprospirales bacterium]|nr:hypothetical protein [Saprospirales bacterium]